MKNNLPKAVGFQLSNFIFTLRELRLITHYNSLAIMHRVSYGLYDKKGTIYGFYDEKGQPTGDLPDPFV